MSNDEYYKIVEQRANEKGITFYEACVELMREQMDADSKSLLENFWFMPFPISSRDISIFDLIGETTQPKERDLKRNPPAKVESFFRMNGEVRKECWNAIDELTKNIHLN